MLREKELESHKVLEIIDRVNIKELSSRLLTLNNPNGAKEIAKLLESV